MSKTMRNLLIGVSAVLCLLGVVLILWPLTYRQIVVYFCGAVLAVFGVIRVILYFAKAGQPGFRFSLSGGILAIIAPSADADSVDAPAPKPSWGSLDSSWPSP